VKGSISKARDLNMKHLIIMLKARGVKVLKFKILSCG
jgi:hypothetical protein